MENQSEKWEWHKFPEELPPEEGRYLVSDLYGHITIKYFKFVYRNWHTNHGAIEGENCFLQGSSRNAWKMANNVACWTFLPTAPKETIVLDEVALLKAQIQTLRLKIEQIEMGVE